MDELRGVKMEEDGTIRIGSLTSFSHITKDEVIKKYIRCIGRRLCDRVGGRQIRNIGTIGGNHLQWGGLGEFGLHPIRLGCHY
ncbi:MAG: FAD binding domain-containing protein [[Clostridium] scindens]